MQKAQPYDEKKCRGILFNFKKCLTDNKVNLHQLCFNVFSFEKEKFSKAQFTQLIRSVDDRLSFDDIDHVMEYLDQDASGHILFKQLNELLKSIKDDDDPFVNELDVQSSKIMLKSKSNIAINNAQKATLFLKDIKDRMKGSDPYQILDIFDMNRDGMLDHLEFNQLAHNYGLTNQNDINLLRNHLYGQRQQLSYKELIKKLELTKVPKRVRFQDLDDAKSHILAPKKIDLKDVKSILKKNPTKQNLIVDEDDDIEQCKPPPQLAPFVNPLSRISEPLQSMATQCLKNKNIFIDKKFPNAPAAHHYEYASSIFGTDYTLFAHIKSAMSAISQKKGSKLAPKFPLETKGAVQGAASSQYLLSAIASIAYQYPEVIIRNFVLLQNPSSIYGLKFFIDGRWKTLITDAFFPVDNKNKLVYATTGSNDIWILLIEKSVAKIYKSYDSLSIGTADQGLNLLTGAPCQKFNINEPGVLGYLQGQLGRKSIVMVCGSKTLMELPYDKQSKLGLSCGRAYTVRGIQKILDRQGKQTVLVNLRYPEGKELGWTGDWSWSSPKWTNELKAKLNYTQQSSKRYFYVSQEQFKMFFGQAITCNINPQYVNSQTRVYAGRTHSHMFQIKIEKEGTYFLSIYQDSKRKYKNSHNYEKSSSRFFLARVADGKLEAIQSKAVDDKDLHQEYYLKPGIYTASCKIKWKFFQRNYFILASYGPATVTFTEIKKNKEFLPAFIKAKAMVRYAGAKKEYYKTIGLNESFRAWEMIPNQGFGYILICNPSKYAIETTLNFSKCEGIKALKPQRFPLTIKVGPNEIKVRGLLVDPRGYNYSLNEFPRIINEFQAQSTKSLK